MIEPERWSGEVIPDYRADKILWQFPQPMFITNAEGVILYCNQEATVILGIEADQIIGKSIGDYFSKENGEKIGNEDIAKVVAGIYQPVESLILHRPDGKRLLIKCRKKRLSNLPNNEVAVLGTIIETTEFNQPEDNIEQSYPHFMKLFESSPHAIAFIDNHGNVLQVNAAAEKLVGYPRNLLVGRKIFDFIKPELLEELTRKFYSYVSGEIKHLDFIFDFIDANGILHKIEINPVKITPTFIVSFIRDITEQHKLQIQIQQTETHLENFFALADDGFFIAETQVPLSSEELLSYDPSDFLSLAEKFIVIRCNQSLANQYNTNIENILGRSLRSFLQHKPQSMVETIRQLHLTGKAHYQVELFKETGESFMAEGSVVFVKDYHGNVTQCIGVHRDMTRMITMQKELAETEERLRLAHEVARLGTWDMDLSSQRIIRNSTWSEMLGYQAHEIELSHQAFLDLLHSEDRPRVETELKRVLIESKADAFEAEFRLRTRQGRYKWIRSKARVIARDGEGKPMRVIGVHLDVDDYHRTLEMLKISEITYRNIIDSVSDALYIQDEEGVFVDVNRAAEQMYGYKKKEIIGKTPEFLSAEGKNDMHAVALAFEKALNGEVQRFEFWGRKADGSIFPKEVVLGPGTYFGLPCVIAVARDISVQVAKEEELKRLVDNLREANAEKDKFFSLIAHDLKSPLSAMLGITELLAEESDRLTLGEIKRISRSLQTSASNVYGLLENLLEWSRIRRRVFDYEPQRVVLRNIVSRVLDTQAVAASRKMVGLLNAVNESIEVYADERMLETILRNLISNAIKFTQRGGFVKVSAHGPVDGQIVVEVKDTGIGIPEIIMDQLFLVTGNAQRRGTYGEPSTGLGLPLCKELVEIHGGKIWAENNTSKGSRFCFTLPDIIHRL